MPFSKLTSGVFCFVLFFLTYVSYLLLAVLRLHCCKGFSPVMTSWGHSLAVGRKLLLVAASVVAEPGLKGAWASVAAALGLRFSSCGIRA